MANFLYIVFGGGLANCGGIDSILSGRLLNLSYIMLGG